MTNAKFRTDDELEAIMNRYIAKLNLDGPFLVEQTKGLKAQANRLKHYLTEDRQHQVLFVIAPDNAFQVLVSAATLKISDDLEALPAMMEAGKVAA